MLTQESGSKRHTTPQLWFLRKRAMTAGALRLGTAPKPCLQALMSEPQTSAELIQQGLVHHRAGPDCHLPWTAIPQVLRNDPRNADALYYIAVVACHEGQFQQGIDLARRSLAFRPRPGARA